MSSPWQGLVSTPLTGTLQHGVCMGGKLAGAGSVPIGGPGVAWQLFPREVPHPTGREGHSSGERHTSRSFAAICEMLMAGCVCPTRVGVRGCVCNHTDIYR